MDAGYLRNTLGQVVAKGCSETIAVAPVDPIQYLSLWLLKYVENAKLVNEFQKEKKCLWQEQRAREDKQRQIELDKTEEIRKQAEKIDLLRSIQNDPYLLFDECLKAVLQFTGGTSAYVALVLDKLWELPKKVSDSEDGESVPNEEELEAEEEEEVEEEGVSGEANSEDASHGEEGDDSQQGGSENSEGESKKKTKSPKPPNYKKKILLYVAATPNNEYLINKKLDKKIGPTTFSVLLKGLPKLHIAFFFYQEGVHFFQGLPLMGAYLTIPISLNATLVQVIALLCVDTLRKEHAGTGRPFSFAEQDFIAAVAQAATQVLSTTLPAATGSFNTKSIMKELQDQLLQLELSHKAESKRVAKGDDETQGEPKKEGEEEEGKDEEREAHNEVDEKESKGLEDIKDDDAGADIDEEDGTENNVEEAKEEDEEEPEEDEGQEEADQHDDVDDNQKQMQEVGKLLKQQQRKVAKLQKHFKKCQTQLEKQVAKVAKLEKQLTRSNGMLSHLCALLTSVSDTIVKHKDEVFGQIMQCLFPSASVYRVLKALLHVLGHTDDVIHDWTRSRRALNEDICTVMKKFSSMAEMALKKWDLSDVFLDGITEEKLSEEAPIGYLGQQWLLAAKKVAFETVKRNNLKTKSEKAAKDFADVEVEQMVAEIDLRVAIDEEKKLSFHLEDLQSKFAKELSSSPTDAVDHQNVIEEDGSGGEEE